VKAAIRTLLLAGQKLWIGTDKGVLAYECQTGKFQQIPHEHLPSQQVLSMLHAGGRIWIGTEGGLASCLPNGSGWRTIRKEDKLVHDVVSAIAADIQYLWVGSMGGGFTRISGILKE